jgi:hypothetical protein
VKDAQGGQVQGRVKWRRFAAVLLPAAVATAGLMGGVANGAVPAQITVSGQTFKVSADRLEGDNFTQYGAVASLAGGKQDPTNPAKNKPVAESYIGHAWLQNLCQSVGVPGMPGVGLLIKAGNSPDKTKQAEATDMLIDMTDLRGEATFTNINIGQDAGTLTGHGTPGLFGQGATKVVITNLQQTARATSAGTFTLRGLNLSVKVGDFKECF